MLIIYNILIIFSSFLINLELKKVGTGMPKEEISGFVAHGPVTLCLDTGAPLINIFYPTGPAIVNGTINISTNLSNPQEKTDFTLTFYYLNSSITSEIGEDSYDGDYNFNRSWDTTLVADGNCNYKVKVQGESNETCCLLFNLKYSDFFTVDNAHVEPVWSNFQNSVTTNFSLYNRWSNLSDIVTGNTHGLINFSGSGWNFDSVNIDNEIVIANRSINFTITSDCFSTFSLNLLLFNFNLGSPVVLRNGETCPVSICSNINSGNNTLEFTVNSFGNYSGTGNATSNLEIWDDTDSQGGGLTKLATENTKFFANYSYNPPISGDGVFCEIKFNISQAFTSPVNMDFNSSSGLYEYAINFSSRGNYSWNVFCNGLVSGYRTQNLTDNITIANTPPALISNISNIDWNEDTIVTGLNLYDYFSDVDGDNLTFAYSAVSNILIIIDSDGIVSFIPDTNWYGLRKVVFAANDSINTTYSNNVILTVNDVPESTESQSSAATSGGGGGGGGGGGSYACTEEWYCTPWGACIDKIRTRTCYDLNNCGTTKNKPNETEACEYVAACYDNICNNNEDCTKRLADIPDCGGPCPPCFTCFDRQKNQDETDIDCGGKACNPCSNSKKCLVDSDCESNYCNPNKICSIPSCSDGWQNQGEEGVDCGGPCPKCPILEQPTFISRLSPLGVLTGTAVILSLLLLINTFGRKLPRKIPKKLLILYRKLPQLRKITPEKGLAHLVKNVIYNLNILEKNLNPKNTHYIFDKLIAVFRVFLQSMLNLKPHFTEEQLNERLEAIKINKGIKRVLIIYYNNLLKYSGSRLTTKEVSMFIRQGKKIVFLLLREGFKK